MGLNLEKLRNRQLETSKSSGKFFKPESGKKAIVRIFKFKHKVTSEDVKQGFFTKDEIDDIAEELDRPVTLQYNFLPDNKKPVITNQRSRAEYERLSRSTEDEDLERAAKIKPSKKYFVNVVDIDHIDNGMMVWSMPKSVYNALLEILMEKEYGGEDKVIGSKGRDFVLKFDKTKPASEMYKLTPRESGYSEKLSKSLEEQTIDLYDPRNISLFGAVLEAEVVEKDEDDDDGEKPKKKREEDDEDDNKKPTKKETEDVDDWLSGKDKKKNGKK